MRHMLKYFFSIPLLFSMFMVQAQETTKTKETVQEKPKSEIKKPAAQQVTTDTIPPKTDRYGLRVGVDVYKLTRGFYDKDYKGVEFTGDFRLTKKYYLAAELGFEDKTTDDDRVNSTATGTYIKGGFDYNTYQNWLDMENLITIGLRGGFSTFSQQLNTYKIYNRDPYWSSQESIVSGEKYNGLTAAWLEVAMGVKAKVFNNVFVGFGVQLKLLVSNKEPGNFENLYIPGFNRTYDGNFGVGFNYTVSYFIPLYKKKVIIPEIKDIPKK
ncbi:MULTISPECIES: DUF6048 family protein [Flavobacterium]|uniref:DUF6048 family protein n=1 Tax=Flavobacterium cupriresistens TaxID=2893885 RepID=A0ABU4R6K0_9FLAO|nr:MULTISPECIES: DUF6048 family protein [unclassified Flavobacterium]KLT70044.1 hypothetical protein AB674_10125 [Flavobacterium sp. ABG]MDX6188225.1 DUF6048 family protein [Flavobacterium sp. Fl-318]UFH45013.1 DUF6048 family protein [Flavobacterium sp. F-323]